MVPDRERVGARRRALWQVVTGDVVAMAALLALLSLLGACSGLLDLPDRPRVSAETTAPLEPQRDPHGADAWREPRAWPPDAVGTSPSEPREGSTADAGVDETRDAGSDDRLGAG